MYYVILVNCICITFVNIDYVVIFVERLRMNSLLIFMLSDVVWCSRDTIATMTARQAKKNFFFFALSIIVIVSAVVVVVT